MVKILGFLLIALYPLNSFAERQYPSETDLKAAYCIPVLQNAIEFMTKFDSYPDLKSLTDKDRATLIRIEAYLIPRIKFVDSKALIVATKSAELDLEETKRINNFCTAKFSNLDDKDKKKLKEILKCQDSEGSEITLRTEKCFKGNFLPY